MISKFSVKKPYTVLVGVVLAIVLGIVAFTRMTTDLLPSISLPYVIVMTTYPGANPETVEMVVTKPVEASMATVSNIESISSVSAENYSMVILEFSQSTDMNNISLEIRENLDQIKSYWDDTIGNPIIMKLNPDMLPVMVAAVGVDGLNHAQISSYVEEALIPEIESLEGVASVTASGLLVESINVIIRQDKIDALNEKVYAAIDLKMEEAYNELTDGKKEINDALTELNSRKTEIKSGQTDLESGQVELLDGKNELTKKQEEVTSQLAATKKDLLTVKTNLEVMKLNLSNNLTTAKSLDKSIQEIELIETAPNSYLTYYQQLMLSISGSDQSGGTQAKNQIALLKESYISNTMLTQVAGNNLQALGLLDWTDPSNFQLVYGTLLGISNGAGATLSQQKDNMKESINVLTNSMGLSIYEAFVNQTLTTLNENLNKVNDGLVEVEKGQLSAAIEFANAASSIQLGEYQMDLAKTQLDSALEQLLSGEEQLKDAKDQLIEGEEKLEEAKNEAYSAANMEDIVTIDMIKGLLTAQNFSMPAGYVTEEGIDYLVRVGDKPSSIEELKAMPLINLHMDGVPVITLEEVADVFYTDNSSEIYSNVNGTMGCIFTIQKQTGYSTGQVSDMLDARFKEMMDNNEDLQIIALMDQGIYIDLVMNSLVKNVLFGAILAIIILIIFLKDIKPTIVIAFSIPISLVTAIVCMYFSGVTLNIISLSGLALGIGMVVDNSIVVIENIYRLRAKGYPIKEAAIQGAKEVGGAIVASTLTTICVFAPIVFTEGITRQLFVDMGLTIAYSLLASLVVALTVVPAMSSKMLITIKDQKNSKIFNKILDIYERVLEVALNIKPIVLILAVVLLGGSVAAAWTNGTAFMADMDSTQLTVSVSLPDDATLQETGELTDAVVDRILEISDIENAGAMSSAGSMSLMGGSASNNKTTIYVVTKENKQATNEEIAVMIKEKTKDLEAEVTVDTSSMDMSALGGSGITIQIRGRDIDTLQEIATQVASIMESVEGTSNVSDGLEESSEELRIIVDKDKAVNYGLTVAQVFTQIAPKLAAASNATSLMTEDNEFDIYIENEKDTQLTRTLLKEMTITGTDEEGKEKIVFLHEIAEFGTARSLDAINRINQTRYISVSATIAEGYNVGKVAGDLEKRMEDYEVPMGYSLVYSGENETINDAMTQVVLMLVLALIFMYLIMVAQFQSLLSPFIIMFTIPLAFTGGFLGLFVSGSEISVIAMIGFVMLSGIIVNNGIVLIDYMNQLIEQGMKKREAIIIAGRTRLRPVLMTALTTILALSTLVFSNDMGAEMSKPMAIVTIGGLLYGTLLTLIVIPCIYDYFMRKQKVTEENEIV